MGIKLRRPALGSYRHEAYLADLESILFLVMIEKNVAVDNLDMVLEKAKIRGVDMTQWGPADFGFSRGQPDLMHTEDIQPFEELVIRKSIEYGIAPRIEIGSVDQARRYIDLGVKHFCVGWDRFIYQSALANIGEGMHKLLSSM
jgi:4-hydroxy-2-oxoheptanedioate aldolase